MSDAPENVTIEQRVAAALKDAEDTLAARVNSLNKTKRLLATARKKVTGKGWHAKTLRKLSSDLRGQPLEPSGPDLVALTDQVSSQLKQLEAQFEKSFRNQLQAKAVELGMQVGRAADDLTIGPFVLSIDLGKETATLDYAKATVEAGLALDAEIIVRTAHRLFEDICTTARDAKKLAAEFGEAIRVCMARQRKRTNQPELRAELPAVYREMAFIRQGVNKTPTKKTFKDFPLACFVVEVATLIQSDFNAKADRHFRLEPAVIENAGNPKKSVFFPKDLSQGYGEGTYYQAIVEREGA